MRSSSSLAASPEASRWDWEDLSANGNGPVDEAQLQALREQELETAYRRGRAEGEEAAHGRARREVANAVAATRSVLLEVQEAQEAWSRVLEENLVALAAGIARRILERELEGDLDAFRGLVQQAVTAFPPAQAVKVRLHPADLAMLAEAGDGVVPDDETTAGREARWIADEDVIPGGCIVEGPDRIVDGRVDEALERIYWGLTRG